MLSKKNLLLGMNLVLFVLMFVVTGQNIFLSDMHNIKGGEEIICLVEMADCVSSSNNCYLPLPSSCTSPGDCEGCGAESEARVCDGTNEGNYDARDCQVYADGQCDSQTVSMECKNGHCGEVVRRDGVACDGNPTFPRCNNWT